MHETGATASMEKSGANDRVDNVPSQGRRYDVDSLWPMLQSGRVAGLNVFLGENSIVKDLFLT